MNLKRRAALTGTPKDKDKLELTHDVICAQSILFFLAGFDTVQSLLLFVSYQLAISREIQDKLAEEVVQSLKKNGRTLTYESINGLEYGQICFG